MLWQFPLDLHFGKVSDGLVLWVCAHFILPGQTIYSWEYRNPAGWGIVSAAGKGSISVNLHLTMETAVSSFEFLSEINVKDSVGVFDVSLRFSKYTA